MERIKVIVEYIVLGIVQGISEMLPISSSGHMKVVKSLLNINNTDLSLEILFHLASLLALFVFFGSRIKDLIINNYLFVVRKKVEYKGDFRVLIQIVIASIPAGIIGILFKDRIEVLFSNIRYVGMALIVTSLVLYAIYFIPYKNKDLNNKRALGIGLFQMIGIIPGISRSGITYLGSKCMGMEKKKASEFVFLMLLPITLGSFIFSLSDITSLFIISNIIPSIVGFIFSFIFTYLSLSLFDKVMEGKRVLYFSLYCFVLGVLVMFFL